MQNIYSLQSRPTMHRFVRVMIFAVSTFCVAGPAVFAQATPADDAASLYLQAGKRVSDNYTKNIMCPSASNLEYTSYPPFPEAWNKMEAENFPANQPARDLAHQARATDKAVWPEIQLPNPDLKYLNLCRALSNELADAALYEHLQGDDAAAIETIRDQFHLSDMLEHADKQYLVMLLVGVGIRSQALDRLNVIAAGMQITKDPQNHKAVQTEVIRGLIAQLLKHPSAREQLDRALKTEPGLPDPITAKGIENCIRTLNRCHVECDMTAVALAVHLYRFDHGDWPTSLKDLREYLPSVPVDLYGDGKKTLGYVLIKHGLPDGSDRPLVYSRGEAATDLFYRTDEPFYSYYSGDGSKLPYSKQKHGGQLRDITAWVPAAAHQATTQSLPH